jgi:hypothetical protein
VHSSIFSQSQSIRKKKFALQRSVALNALEALVRNLAWYLALKRIQRAVRDLYVAVALERYIWQDVYYARKVPSQLPFERSK